MLNNHNLYHYEKHITSHRIPIRMAIILATGLGVRLKDLYRLTPKGCLRLGEKSIIEESIISLLGTGIERIVIVTGLLAGLPRPSRRDDAAFNCLFRSAPQAG